MPVVDPYYATRRMPSTQKRAAVAPPPVGIHVNDILGRLQAPQENHAFFNQLENDYDNASLSPVEHGMVADAAAKARGGAKDIRFRGWLRAIESMARKSAELPGQPMAPQVEPPQAAAPMPVANGLPTGPLAASPGFNHAATRGMNTAQRQAMVGSYLDQIRRQAMAEMQQPQLAQQLMQGPPQDQQDEPAALGPRMNTLGPGGNAAGNSQAPGGGFPWQSRAPAPSQVPLGALMADANRRTTAMSDIPSNKEEYTKALIARQQALNKGATLDAGPNQLADLPAWNPRGVDPRQARTTVRVRTPTGEGGMGMPGVIQQALSARELSHEDKLAARVQAARQQGMTREMVRRGLTTPEIELARTMNPQEFNQALAFHHPEAWAAAKMAEAQAAARNQDPMANMTPAQREAMMPDVKQIEDRHAAEAAIKQGTLMPQHYQHLKNTADSIPGIPQVGMFGSLGGTDRQTRKLAMLTELKKIHPNLKTSDLSAWYDKVYQPVAEPYPGFFEGKKRTWDKTARKWVNPT